MLVNLPSRVWTKLIVSRQWLLQDRRDLSLTFLKSLLALDSRTWKEIVFLTDLNEGLCLISTKMTWVQNLVALLRTRTSVDSLLKSFSSTQWVVVKVLLTLLVRRLRLGISSVVS